jgi:Ribbon-helix-helix protein, copG family
VRYSGLAGILGYPLIIDTLMVALDVRCAAPPRHALPRVVMERESKSQLSIRVEAELRERLERLAAREDRPLSYLVRRVLRAAAHEAEAGGRAA